MSTCNSISNYYDSEDECGLDIKHRKSFPVTENSSCGGYRNRDEDFESTSSESTSAGSAGFPISTTDSSLRGESKLHQRNPTLPFYPTDVHEKPQRYVQQANVAHVPVEISVGWPHVQGHPRLTNIQHSQPLQPMQQCQARTQDWARMPTSATGVPFMMHSDGCRSAPMKPAASLLNSSNLPSKQPESPKERTATGGVGEGAPVIGNEEDDLWPGNVNYAEYQENGSSNLFATWSGTKTELVEKIQSYNLQVRDIFTTVDDNIYNIIFARHTIARKAFTMQQQMGVRLIPPKNSSRIWLRNPSPSFIVKFETKWRLVVNKGKAEYHDVIGELQEGCVIYADQLKGYRIRLVCCEGGFKFPGGKIVEMKGLPNNSDKKTSLGWISFRCKYTKESLVIRKSWNKLGDYVFKGK